MVTYKAGDETKEKVLLAAKTLFYENGFKSTSCAMIAKHADVNIALITYHFKSKLYLGLAVYNELTTDVRNAVRQKAIEAGYEFDQIIGLGIENKVFSQLYLTNNNYKIFINEFCNANGLLLSDRFSRIDTNSLKEKYHIRLSELDERIAHYCMTSISNGFIAVMDTGRIGEVEYPIEKLTDMELKIIDIKKKDREISIQKSNEIYDKITISLTKDFTIN